MNPLVPLFHERDGALEERLRPFLEAGALDEGVVPIVDVLTASMHPRDPDAILALVLALAAPARGHVCVDLAHTSTDHWQSEGTDATPLPFPSDRARWCDTVAACPLVRLADANAPLGERPFILDGTRLYTKRSHHYERRLADQLLERLHRPPPALDAERLRTGLDTLFPNQEAGLDRQKLAAAIACMRALTVISGGPGTGKTYTVRNVLTLLWAQWWAHGGASQPNALGPSTVLAAPTGKAASRISESLEVGLEDHCRRAVPCLPKDAPVAQLEAWLRALDPGTLHRVLGFRPNNPSRFRHHADHPLAAEIVIVDEASMVDFAMMSKLVDAVPAQARFILLGDQQQLASVEAGTVLADLCGPSHADAVVLSERLCDALADVLGPVSVDRAPPERGMQDAIVLLNRSRRFGADSGIGRFSQRCNAPRFDLAAATEALVAPTTPDVHTLGHAPQQALPSRATDDAMAHIKRCIRAALQGPEPGESHPTYARRILQSWQDFQILCAHRRGRTGVKGVHAHLMRQLSAWVAQAPSDDPLHALDLDARHWVGRPILVRRNDPASGRYNGDFGVILPAENGMLQAVFPDGATGVAWLPTARLPAHQTVLAMTIHKSQGSEYGHVMVVLPDRPSPILTRELVYTGVTRAKERMTLVANQSVLESGLSQQVVRVSGLRDALWGPSSSSGRTLGPDQGS